MKAKKFLVGFLAAAVAVSGTVPGISAEDEEISDHGISEEIAIFDPATGNYVYENGTIMEPIRGSRNNIMDGDGAGSLPEKYDSRETFSSLGLNFPAIRNQNPTGTCWVHSAMAAMEIRGLKEGLFTNSDNVNFAESQIAYFSALSSPDENDPYYGDNFCLCPDHSVEDRYDRGGIALMAASTMARGIGPYAESHSSSLPINDTNATKALDESLRYKSDYQVIECTNYNEKDSTAIKEAIMEYGAVTLSYYHSSAYCSKDKSAYYNPNGTTSTNHAINVIGWDDNYSSSNFDSNNGAPDSDGAWLCRNSWGSYFGDEGYFYISYEEAELSKFYAVKAAPKNTYTKVYGYDGACPATLSTTSGYTIANIFTAESSDYVVASAFYTIDENVNYTLKIYTDVDDDDPESGELKSEQTGTIKLGGYHTIDLDTPVYVPKGTKFSVVLTSSDTKQYIDSCNSSAGRSFEKHSYWWFDTYDSQVTLSCGLNNNDTSSEKYHKVSFTTNYNVPVRALTGTPDIKKPAAPTGLKAEKTVGQKNIILSCDAVEDAVAYYFYITAASTGITAQYSSVEPSINAFFPVIGESYSIYSTYFNKNNIESEPSAAISFMLPAAPVNVTASVDGGYITLSWDKVAGADRYAVYCVTENGYSFNTYSEINGLDISGAAVGTEYKYAVTAVKDGIESDYSDVISVIPYNKSAPTIMIQPDTPPIIGGTMFVIHTRACGQSPEFKWEYNDGSGWKTLQTSDNITQTDNYINKDIIADSILLIGNTNNYENVELRCIVTDSNGNSVTSDTYKLTFKDEKDVSVSNVDALDVYQCQGYVEYILTLNRNNDTFVLTDAQMRAMERVIEEDYK